MEEGGFACAVFAKQEIYALVDRQGNIPERSRSGIRIGERYV